MKVRKTPTTRLALRVVLGLFVITPVAAADEEKKYTDEKYGFALTVPGPWAEAPLAGYTVPGTARAVWSGPANASIVAFVQEPGQPLSPRFLTDRSAEAM